MIPTGLGNARFGSGLQLKLEQRILIDYKELCLKTHYHSPKQKEDPKTLLYKETNKLF